LLVSSTIRTAPSRNSRSYFFRFSGISILIVDASTVRGEPQVDGLGILVGQHKTADQRYRAAIAKGLTILRDAGYPLDPGALHTHAIASGWRASNAAKLREVATRINEGRIIQGMKSAPLADDVLTHWRARASAHATPED
ncbi:hypothetical protein QWY28_00005, partial [Nocardioides sp. SOB77]